MRSKLEFRFFISIQHRISVGQLKLMLSELCFQPRGQLLTCVNNKGRCGTILENILKQAYTLKIFLPLTSVSLCSSKQASMGEEEFLTLRTSTHLFQKYLLPITDLINLCPLVIHHTGQSFTVLSLVSQFLITIWIVILHSDRFHGKLPTVGFNILI